MCETKLVAHTRMKYVEEISTRIQLTATHQQNNHAIHDIQATTTNISQTAEKLEKKFSK